MSDRLVTIATFHDPVSATLAKNFLDSEFIPAILMDESTVATDWALAGAIGGIKLQVPAIHVERAELLLAQIEEDRQADEEAEVPPQSSFATEEAAEELRAESEDKDPINQLADRAYRSSVFGLLFWPLQVYVLLLFLKILGTDGRVSQNRRWKVWVAVLLNLPILFVLLYAITCAFGGAFSGCDDVPAHRWSWHDGPEKRFQIKMPGKIRDYGYKLPSPHGPLEFYGIQSPEAEIQYFATVCECPKSVGRMDRKSALEEMVKLHVYDQRERVAAQSVFAVGDFDAIEFTIASVGEDRRGIIYFRRDTLYVLEMYGPADSLRSEEAERFFQSMRWR